MTSLETGSRLSVRVCSGHAGLFETVGCLVLATPLAPPTSLKVVPAAEGSVLVSWDEPATGGSAVDRYEVEWQ